MAIPYQDPSLVIKLHAVFQIVYTVHLQEYAANAINGTCGMEAIVWKEQAFCARMGQKDISQMNATTTVQVIPMR